MSGEQLHFLSLLEVGPARLTVEQVGTLLNCNPHDIPPLIAAKLLKPLGSPRPYAVKYFATVEILELRKNPTWLAKMTNALYRFWEGKNAARKANAKSKHATISSLAA